MSFLPGTFPAGAAAQTGLVVTFNAALTLGTDTLTHTYNNVSIGEEAMDRIVVVLALCERVNAGTQVITAATIGGSGTTALAQDVIGDAGFNHAAIFYRAIPTGTTATISLTSNATLDQSNIFVYSLYGAKNSTPTATQIVASGSQIQLNPAFQAGGVIIYAVEEITGGATNIIYSNAMEVFDQVGNFGRHSSAWKLSGGIETVTKSGGTNMYGIAVSWR